MSLPNYKYQCSNNSEHKFEEPTGDFWCPLCDISTKPMLNSIQQTPEEILETAPVTKPEQEVEISTAKLEKLEVIKPPPVFQTIKIGNQTWMKSFLSVQTFQDGTNIIHAKNEKEWVRANENKLPAFRFPHYDSKLGNTLGFLYNFYAVNHPSILPPTSDWQVPSLNDIVVLQNENFSIFLEDNLKKSMEKDIFHCLAYGTMIQTVHKRIFWSRTQKIDYTAHAFSVDNEKKMLKVVLYDKGAGFFVRCIKSN